MAKGAMIAAGLGLGAVLVMAYLKKKDLVKDAAAGAVGVATDVAVGGVLGIGSVFGLPETDAAKCAAAKASGSLFEQSLYCPALDFVSQAPATVVEKIGSVVGVPRTDETKCQKALREGDTWAASFACPAGTFIGSFFGA
jgi:hypothetical protein